MRVLWAAALCCALAAATMLAAAPPPAQADFDRQFLAAWDQQVRHDVRVPAAGAKVVVVKFNDWMCPGCRIAYQTFKPLLAKYQAIPGALKYIEKDWPWNRTCNAGTAQTFTGHEASCDAAAAVRLAADRGRRDAMAEWLYANQPATDAQRAAMPGRVRAKAIELLGLKDFAAAAATKLPDVRKDVADGMALGINSTPTYFINGVRAVGGDGSTIPPHLFEIALQHEYQKHGGK
jgi:protein-disulfide isomerase